MRWPKYWSLSFRISPSSVLDASCCCLVIKLCPTLRDPMGQSMPGPPVFHCFPELGQIHVASFSDTVHPSHPLSSSLLLPSNFPKIRVFSRESSLLMRWPKYWSLSFRISLSSEHSGLIPSEWIGLFSLQFRGLSGVSSSTIIQKHQFFSGQPSLWSSSHFHTSLQEKP